MITTEFDFVQPVAVIVSVKVYVVVVVGVTDGLLAVEVKPLGLLTQLYVSPVTGDAPTVAVPPLVMDWLLPAFADGTGFTVITTLWLFVQPPAVIVSVNV